MEFIGTPTFTRMVTELLSDDEYRELKNILVEDPGRGDLIKGGGGIRKLCHAVHGRGKGGGGSGNLLLGQGQSPNLHAGGLSKGQKRQFD